MSLRTEIRIVECGKCGNLSKVDIQHHGDVQCPYCKEFLVIRGQRTGSFSLLEECGEGEQG